MPRKSIFPLLTLVVAGLFQPAAVWGQCNPEDRNTWERVYRFPAEGEEGKAISVSRESLLDARRIRPGYAPWLAVIVPSLLKAGLEGAEVTKLEIFRDCQGHPRVIVDGVKQETAPAETASGNPVFIAVEVAEQGEKSVSKWRRFIGILIRAGVPTLLSFASSGAGFVVGSVIAQPIASAIDRGAKNHRIWRQKPSDEAMETLAEREYYNPVIREVLRKRGLEHLIH